MTADPDMLVTLTTARTEFEGANLVNVLKAAGIPARVFAATANTMQWEAGYSDPIKVQVRRQDLERAGEEIRRNKQASVDLDWDEIDVGQFEDMAAEARPRFSFATQRNRRQRRALIAGVGMALITCGFMVSMMGPRFALPVAMMAVMMVVGAWFKSR
jgi:hypothetical protein